MPDASARAWMARRGPQELPRQSRRLPQRGEKSKYDSNRSWTWHTMRSMTFSNRPGARFRRYGRLTTCFVLAAWGIGTSAAGFAQTPALIEGDIWHKADVARATFRRADGSLVDGSGVKVCVMSDSIDNSVGSLAAARRLTPPAVPASIDMPAGQGTGNGEGLAMLEVVHKIAPGAALGFAPMRGTPSENKQTIEALVSAGCKIIVDDNTDERDAPFQDGVVAQAISAATTNGVLFVSSAGNFGNFQHGTAGVWEGDFKDGGKWRLLGPPGGCMRSPTAKHTFS